MAIYLLDFRRLKVEVNCFQIFGRNPLVIYLINA